MGSSSCQTGCLGQSYHQVWGLDLEPDPSYSLFFSSDIQSPSHHCKTKPEYQKYWMQKQNQLKKLHMQSPSSTIAVLNIVLRLTNEWFAENKTEKNQCLQYCFCSVKLETPSPVLMEFIYAFKFRFTNTPFSLLSIFKFCFTM